jgi:hypothetical protein
VKRLRLLCFLAFLLAGFSQASIQDDSSAIFLPKNLRELADSSKKFSFFWRGLFLIENTAQGLEYKSKLCAFLKNNDEAVSDYYCGQSDFKINTKDLREWVQDTSLRRTPPSKLEFLTLSQKQLASASLPGTPKEFLRVLRLDPMGESTEFWKLKQASISFPQDKSIFFVPFSFAHSPEEVELTKNFLKEAENLCGEACPKKALLGPHAAILTNQEQVKKDLGLVTLVGAILFMLTAVFMGKSRGLALLSLLGPLVIALIVAVATTVFVFGSIHGLTLAFGPSLVGLVLDYGIHTKIHKGSKAAWSSNLFGLLTTLSGFIALAFSEIPLVRQIMVFSVVGLVTSFILYYFFSQSRLKLWTATEFKVFAFKMNPNTKTSKLFSISVLLASFALLPFIKLDLNLKNFEFRQEYQTELESKLWTKGVTPELLFKLRPTSKVQELDGELQASISYNLPYQSWRTYVLAPQEQQSFLSLWRQRGCNEYKFSNDTANKFYEPFKELNLCQASLRSPEQAPAYARDFVSQDAKEVLSVWSPKNKEERDLVLRLFPSATSLRSLFEKFPEFLLRDIGVMFPVGLLMCFLLIFYHTRSVGLSLLALVPMFSSIGLVLMVFVLLGKSFSFVSCVALLIIFGSSVDYGIFKVDSLREAPSSEADAKIFSSLFMNALLTFVGYVPLLFAKHPVLNDLGWVLSVGTVGAFLGGVWGVSFLSQKIKLRIMEIK